MNFISDSPSLSYGSVLPRLHASDEIVIPATASPRLNQFDHTLTPNIHSELATEGERRHHVAQGQVENEKVKYQIGLSVQRLPYAKVLSLYSCKLTHFSKEDLVYLIDAIPEHAIMKDTIEILEKPVLDSSTHYMRKFSTGQFRSHTNKWNKCEYEQFQTLKKSAYLLEGIQKRKDFEPIPSSVANSELKENEASEFETKNVVHSKISSDGSWTNLAKEKRVGINLIKDQLEGRKGETVSLILRLLVKKKKKGSTDEIDYNPVIRLKLKFGVKNVSNEIRTFLKPKLKQEFDLIDASAKVISLLSRITMSNKWASCSPNTYGK